jgi:aryl-alcohol dehydrogenase-like predicted oxidoreductase
MTTRPEGVAGYQTEATFDALDELAAEASTRGVSMAALALAWLLHVPEVTAIVVGPNTVDQLAPVADALEVRLSASDHARIGGLFA